LINIAVIRQRNFTAVVLPSALPVTGFQPFGFDVSSRKLPIPMLK